MHSTSSNWLKHLLTGHSLSFFLFFFIFLADASYPLPPNVPGLEPDALPTAASLAKLRKWVGKCQPQEYQAGREDPNRPPPPPSGAMNQQRREILASLWALCQDRCQCPVQEGLACPVRLGRGLPEGEPHAGRDGCQSTCQPCQTFTTFGAGLLATGRQSVDQRNQRLAALLAICPAVVAMHEMALSHLERNDGKPCLSTVCMDMRCWP